MGEVIFCGVLAIGSMYLFVLTFQFPVNIMDKSGGAGLFPQIVLGFLFVFLVIRIIDILRKNEKGAFVFLEMFKGIRLFFLAALISYIVLINYLGYILSTVLFMGILINILYYRMKKKWGNLSNIVTRNMLIIFFAVVMNLFFSKMLHVMLPTGVLF